MPGAALGAPGDADSQIGVVIVAAGQSQRMEGVDKTFVPILGLPLICHTVKAFERSALVQSVVLVLSSDKVDFGWSLAREHGWKKVVSVCHGGPRRQDSVFIGLKHLKDCGWVAIHDGARPCCEPELLERGLEAARETGASIAAVPAKDTIKVVSPEGQVQVTPARDNLWMVQTPQVFHYDLILGAHMNCDGTFTDDAAMVESIGHPVKVFMGSYRNLKITTPEDLAMAEIFLRSRNGQ